MALFQFLDSDESQMMLKPLNGISEWFLLLFDYIHLSMKWRCILYVLVVHSEFYNGLHTDLELISKK